LPFYIQCIILRLPKREERKINMQQAIYAPTYARDELAEIKEVIKYMFKKSFLYAFYKLLTAQVV
jgi:hypothetical protein